MAPSATACALASGSSPPTPAPWAMVATCFTPGLRQARAISAERSRAARRSNSSALPMPATSTRGAAILPKVCTMVRSPALPRTSPSSMRRLMSPSSARSTAPVAPPGLVTPSNRLTATTSASVALMSPEIAVTSMSLALPGNCW